jgi:hypothetical protein
MHMWQWRNKHGYLQKRIKSLYDSNLYCSQRAILALVVECYGLNVTVLEYYGLNVTILEYYGLNVMILEC